MQRCWEYLTGLHGIILSRANSSTKSLQAMDRTYNLTHHANKSKVSRITATIKAYRKTAAIISGVQWMRFYKDAEPFNKNLKIKTISSIKLTTGRTALSERYKQTCQYQVVSVVNSFISNRKNDFARTVVNSLLPEETKIKLLTINKYGWWYRRELRRIDKETLKLARNIFNHILSRHRKPGFKHISMHLDQKVAVISACSEFYRTSKSSGNATEFDYWVRLSILDKGNPAYIPVKTNHYFETIAGKRKNFCQIGLTDDGDITVSFIKDVPDNKDIYKPLVNKISLDTGLKTLFTTDRGDLTGRSFYETLSDLDRRITAITSNRQRQGLKVRSKKYDRIVFNLRAYLKNEINRCLNRLTRIYSPAEIVVERLDFRNPNLSKRLNRLVSRFGRVIIKAKLQSLSEKFGIKIIETNAAYSSQECSVCGYVGRNNRKTQAEFKCKFCSSGLHADVNAARVHLARSSCRVIDIYKSKKAVLHILVGKFLSSLSDMERKFCMPCSKAKDLLSGNPYFKEAMAQSKGFL